MSTVNWQGRKVMVPRSLDGFWNAVRDVYPDDDSQGWRQLAMLALQEAAGWPVERIARTLGHRPTYVIECIDEVKRALRQRLEPLPRDDEESP